MITTSFDATITLNDHHHRDAGLSTRKADAVAAVRTAIERMVGAGWIETLRRNCFHPNWRGR
jgi:hypothetical protein